MSQPSAAMIATRPDFGWTQLALWVGGTALGWGIGLVPAMMMISGAFWNGTDYEPNMAGKILTICGLCISLGVASGVVVGAAQQAALDRMGPLTAMTAWTMATGTGGAGWIAGWLVSVGVWENFHLSTFEAGAWQVSGIIIGALVGGATGVLQWRVLRRVSPRSGWWLLVSLASWPATLATYWLVYQAAGGPFTTVVTSYYEGSNWPKTIDAPGAGPAMLGAWLAGGLLLGLSTAIAMKFLLTNSRQEQPTPSP